MDITTFFNTHITMLPNNIDLKLYDCPFWHFYELEKLSTITNEILNSKYQILEITL